MRTLLAILVLSYASVAAAAATHYGHGSPITIAVLNDGTVDVFFDPTTQVVGSPPACAGYTGGGIQIRFDTKSDGGRSMLATLLASHANGTPVYYFGSSDCAVYGNKETMTEVAVN